MALEAEIRRGPVSRIRISAPFVWAFSSLLAVLAVCLMPGHFSSPLLNYVPDMATTAQYKLEHLEDLSEAELRVQLVRITVNESYKADRVKEVQMTKMSEEHHRSLKRQKMLLVSEVARRGLSWSEVTNPANR